MLTFLAILALVFGISIVSHGIGLLDRDTSRNMLQLLGYLLLTLGVLGVAS